MSLEGRRRLELIDGCGVETIEVQPVKNVQDLHKLNIWPQHHFFRLTICSGSCNAFSIFEFNIAAAFFSHYFEKRENICTPSQLSRKYPFQVSIH
jgi:hypothetical protein